MNMETRLCRVIEEKAYTDGQFAVAWALLQLAGEVETFNLKLENKDSGLVGGFAAVAHALYALGNGDAATTMGGLEGLGVSIEKGAQVIADAVGGLE